MFELYQHGASMVHRLPPSLKLLALALGGTALFLTDHLAIAGTFCMAVLALYSVAALPIRLAWAQIRPAIWILMILLVTQGLIADWITGAFVVVRLVGLLLLAGLVTLTTRASEMIDTLERGLFPLRWFGANPAKVSLALSLALRFIPVLAAVTTEVREAQSVRGLDRSLIAIIIPVMVRMLKMADEISDAIEARSYDPRG